jgi:hypothetical protein
MKRMFFRSCFCLALAAVPSWNAEWFYGNASINGSVDA